MLYISNVNNQREIISKFFARMYTEQAIFFSEMNKSLMKNENKYDT